MQSACCDTFFTTENLSTYRVHANVYGVNTMTKCTVHLWVHRFHKEEWENIHDKISSRLSDTLTDETRHAVLAIFECD